MNLSFDAYASSTSCNALIKSLLKKQTKTYSHDEAIGHKYLGANIVTNNKGKTIGTNFQIWLPNAKSVELITDFDNWEEGKHVLKLNKETGNWTIFVKDIKEGHRYKFKIVDYKDKVQYRNDPYSRFTSRINMKWDSVVINPKAFKWTDQTYKKKPRKKKLNIMEIHPGTIVPGKPDANFREIADHLIPILKKNNYTTASFMPVSHHNVMESWGYQPGALFSTNYRHGDPDDFKYLVNKLHENDIDVVIDIVHSHASKDWDTGLGGLDGTEPYFHEGVMGEHPDWGTRNYNYGRKEVEDFLLSNAVFWAEEYHVDGFRFDGVASMLYRDYSRNHGEWVAAADGSNWNYEAIEYIKNFNKVLHERFPKLITIAEESSGYPGVTSESSLGFDYMWRMGGMHHIRSFLKEEPGKRNLFTISSPLGWNERYINYANSHDELANGGSYYIELMREGTDEEKFAIVRNIELLNALVYPGHSMRFQGDEFGGRNWWNENVFPDHSLKEKTIHQQMELFDTELNKFTQKVKVLENTHHSSAKELAIDNDKQVGVWVRTNTDDEEEMIIVQNYGHKTQENYKFPLPRTGKWKVTFNSDADYFGGLGVITRISKPIKESMYGHDHVIKVDYLAPRSTLVLERISD